MLPLRTRSILRQPLRTLPTLCRACQQRALQTTARLRAAAPNDPRPEGGDANAKPREASVGQGLASYKAPSKAEGFTPQVLGRPIGFHRPPVPGDYSGRDERSVRQRRDDFVDWDKHIQRRKELTKQVSKPYFRDFTNMQYHSGKSFLANPLVFRRDRALFFPNFVGTTLASPKQERDTTLVLLDRVSVVSVYSSQWGLEQAKTFIDNSANPGLHEVLDKHRDAAQLVELNLEDNALKAMIVKFFQGRLKAERREEDWDKYFLIRRGITDELRENIGLMNSKVGYTFLVDGQCRIRWAASGNAEGEEKEWLNKGLKMLVNEAASHPEKSGAKVATKAPTKARVASADAS